MAGCKQELLSLLCWGLYWLAERLYSERVLRQQYIDYFVSLGRGCRLFA